jgi:hypothetical protein
LTKTSKINTLARQEDLMAISDHRPTLSPCQALFLETLHEVSWRMQTPHRVPMPITLSLAESFFSSHPHKALLWLRQQSRLDFQEFNASWCQLGDPPHPQDVMLVEQTATRLEKDVLARIVEHWNETGHVLRLRTKENGELDEPDEDEDEAEMVEFPPEKPIAEEVFLTLKMKQYLATHTFLERLKGEGLCKRASTWLGEKFWSEEITKKTRDHLQVHQLLGNQGIIGWRVQPEGHRLSRHINPTMTRAKALGFLAYVNLAGLQRSR